MRNVASILLFAMFGTASCTHFTLTQSAAKTKFVLKQDFNDQGCRMIAEQSFTTSFAFGAAQPSHVVSKIRNLTAEMNGNIAVSTAFNKHVNSPVRLGSSIPFTVYSCDEEAFNKLESFHPLL